MDRNLHERVLWAYCPISSVIRCGFAHCESRKHCRNRHFYDEFWRLYTETRLGGGERGIRTLGTELPYTRFPGEPIRPLWHLSYINWVQIQLLLRSGLQNTSLYFALWAFALRSSKSFLTILSNPRYGVTVLSLSRCYSN